jgi:hypothetical protein
VAPVVEYNTVRYNLTPLVEGPFVGFGPKVDEAWDSISESMDASLNYWDDLKLICLQWATR